MQFLPRKYLWCYWVSHLLRHVEDFQIISIIRDLPNKHRISTPKCLYFSAVFFPTFYGNMLNTVGGSEDGSFQFLKIWLRQKAHCDCVWEYLQEHCSERCGRHNINVHLKNRMAIHPFPIQYNSRKRICVLASFVETRNYLKKATFDAYEDVFGKKRAVLVIPSSFF